MKGNLINDGICGRSNAGESSFIDWGGLIDVGDLVSCLLEGALDLLLSASG